MVQCRRRDEQIGLGERVSRLSALLDKETPPEDHILVDVEHSCQQGHSAATGASCRRYGVGGPPTCGQRFERAERMADDSSACPPRPARSTGMTIGFAISSNVLGT